MTATRPSPRADLDPEALEALEDQRDFLLGSLRDLEREFEAGDVDERDYLTLKDDYTARAAAVLRAIEAGRQRSGPPTPARSRARRIVAVAAVIAFAAAAGWLVTRTAGERGTGEGITGGIRQSVTELLNEAGRLGAQGDFDGAVARYDEVLEQQPSNAEALTYKGWMLFLRGDGEDGLSSLLEAATTEPGYPDVHAFLAIVLYRNGLVDEAARELDRLDALDPPAAVRSLIEGLRAEIHEAGSGGASTSTTVAPSGR